MRSTNDDLIRDAHAHWEDGARLARIGGELQGRARFEDACIVLERAVTLAPENPDAWAQLRKALAARLPRQAKTPCVYVRVDPEATMGIYAALKTEMRHLAHQTQLPKLCFGLIGRPQAGPGGV